MANQRMKESWANMKSSIRDIWGEDLSDKMLKQGRRDLNKMVDVIHEHTGAPRKQIRSQINYLL